jgi:cysteine desulfurase/selenocysteine lyase
VVWGRQELLEAMPPYHVGSNMAHEVDFERAVLEHAAQKFQAGTPDVAGPVGLAAAVNFIDRIGRDALWKHDQELVRHGLARLAEIRRLRLIGPKSADNRIPVFTFVFEGQLPTGLAKFLDQQGIAIRAGDMAALPLLKRFGTAEAARASAYVYSTRSDIDRLADALDATK